MKLLTRFKKDTSKAGDEDNQVMAEILNSVQFDDSAHKQDQDHHVGVLINLLRKILGREWKKSKNGNQEDDKK